MDCGAATGAVVPTPTTAPTAEGTASAGEATAIPTVATPTGPVYHTVMTGVGLSNASVSRDELGRWVINFELTPEGSRIFGAHTCTHIDQFLAIVLDKMVISAPRIDNGITTGTGTISGSFTQQSSNQLALQLRSGALPVPLKVVQSREIGPSLGQDSAAKEHLAGIIGVAVMAFYMLPTIGCPA